MSVNFNKIDRKLNESINSFIFIKRVESFWKSIEGKYIHTNSSKIWTKSTKSFFNRFKKLQNNIDIKQLKYSTLIGTI